jgi:hypothetical protein
MHIYLYVKQHQSTGLKYFGKTTCQDPFAYRGSGKYWKNHLKKHGADINTIELWGFDNQDACTRFALEFSEKHHIVESKEWANLIPENGMDGTTAGIKFSEEIKSKMRAARLGKPRPENLGKKRSEETKAKMRAAKLGKKLSEEHKVKIGASNIGRKHSEETKAKMRSAKLGTPFSAEHKAKMRARIYSEETKANMRKAQRARHARAAAN